MFIHRLKPLTASNIIDIELKKWLLYGISSIPIKKMNVKQICGMSAELRHTRKKINYLKFQAPNEAHRRMDRQTTIGKTCNWYLKSLDEMKLNQFLDRISVLILNCFICLSNTRKEIFLLRKNYVLTFSLRISEIVLGQHIEQKRNRPFPSMSICLSKKRNEIFISGENNLLTNFFIHSPR